MTIVRVKITIPSPRVPIDVIHYSRRFTAAAKVREAVYSNTFDCFSNRLGRWPLCRVVHYIPTRCIIIVVSDEDRIINRQRIRAPETVVRRLVGGLQGGIGGVEHRSVCKVLPNNKNAEKENIIKHVYIQMHWRLWNK